MPLLRLGRRFAWFGRRSRFGRVDPSFSEQLANRNETLPAIGAGRGGASDLLHGSSPGSDRLSDLTIGDALAKTDPHVLPGIYRESSDESRSASIWT
jgi:hypothetical protein